MKPVVILTGVLGGGTALVFALALGAGALFPSGTLLPVNGMWGSRDVFVAPGGFGVGGGVVNVGSGVAVPMPAPPVNVVTLDKGVSVSTDGAEAGGTTAQP